MAGGPANKIQVLDVMAVVTGSPNPAEILECFKIKVEGGGK